MIRKQGIFIPKPLEHEFMETIKMIRSAYSGQYIRTVHEMPPPEESQGTSVMLTTGDHLLDELKAKVRKHLMETIEPTRLM